MKDPVAVALENRAKRAYDSAKMKSTENVEEIGIFLAAARKTELEATKHFRITSRNTSGKLQTT